MKTANINRWIFFIPLSDVETEGCPERGAQTSCICCGKRIKSAKYMVHLLTDGNLVSTDEPIANSQGFFPIGAECKNRLPNNFVFNA